MPYSHTLTPKSDSVVTLHSATTQTKTVQEDTGTKTGKRWHSMESKKVTGPQTRKLKRDATASTAIAPDEKNSAPGVEYNLVPGQEKTPTKGEIKTTMQQHCLQHHPLPKKRHGMACCCRYVYICSLKTAKNGPRKPHQGEGVRITRWSLIYWRQRAHSHREKAKFGTTHTHTHTHTHVTPRPCKHTHSTQIIH